MPAKQIAYDVDAREKILRGVQKLAKAVKVTGPNLRGARGADGIWSCLPSLVHHCASFGFRSALVS